MTDTTLRKSIYLNASKEQVWEYLTDPDKLAIWFHKPKSPLKGGEDYAMYGAESGDKLMWGEVLKSNPYDELEYTFTIAPMGKAVSTVNWKLEDVAGGNPPIARTHRPTTGRRSLRPDLGARQRLGRPHRADAGLFE